MADSSDISTADPTVDSSTDTIIDISRAKHLGHADKSPCEIEVGWFTIETLQLK